MPSFSAGNHLFMPTFSQPLNKDICAGEVNAQDCANLIAYQSNTQAEHLRKWLPFGTPKIVTGKSVPKPNGWKRFCCEHSLSDVDVSAQESLVHLVVVVCCHQRIVKEY